MKKRWLPLICLCALAWTALGVRAASVADPLAAASQPVDASKDAPIVAPSPEKTDLKDDDETATDEKAVAPNASTPVDSSEAVEKPEPDDSDDAAPEAPKTPALSADDIKKIDGPAPVAVSTPPAVVPVESPAAPAVKWNLSVPATSQADVPAVPASPHDDWSSMISSTTLSGGIVKSRFGVDTSTGGEIFLEKVSVDDAGTRLLVLIQTSRPTECFVFERRDPPSLYIQFLSSAVYASGDPVQVVGTDPLSEIRYGYSTFHAATEANRDETVRYPLEYIQLRLNRPVFYHVQQEGWVVVVGLDRTTTKVEIPELDFRFQAAKYQGAANLPLNPRVDNFVEVAQANSRLLAVARDEAELAKFRVSEARRTLYPQATARLSQTNGKEVNPFPQDAFEGFETASYVRREYGVQLTQPIYESGKLYGAFKQAKLNRLMALENVRKQAQDLTYEVKKAYFSLLKNQSNLRIRRELVAQGQVLEDMTRKKLKLQLTARSELLNVTAQADQAQYQLTSDEQDVALARLVLISLMNQADPVQDPVPGALSFGRLSFNVESIIAWAQEHRPDVRIATLNAELARYSWKAAAADENVRVDASGFYGRAGAAFSDEDFNLRESWNVGLKVSRSFWGNTVRGNYSKEHTAPDLGQAFVTESQQRTVEVGILDALPGMSATRQAQLQFERAKAELVEASRKAEFEVRQTYYNLEKASRQLEAVREDLKFRQKDAEISREKVRLGLAELSQLMTAEVAYAQAQITEQDALSAYNVALADMDRVAGAEVVKE